MRLFPLPSRPMPLIFCGQVLWLFETFSLFKVKMMVFYSLIHPPTIYLVEGCQLYRWQLVRGQFDIMSGTTRHCINTKIRAVTPPFQNPSSPSLLLQSSSVTHQKWFSLSSISWTVLARCYSSIPPSLGTCIAELL